MLKSHMLILNFVCRLCALEKKVFVENGDMPETVLEMKAKVEELKQKLEVIYMSTNVCIHVRAHTHTHTHEYTHIHTHTSTHTYTHTYTYTHAYTHTHIHTHTNTYTRVHTHEYIHIHFHQTITILENSKLRSKGRNLFFNDTLNTFYFLLHCNGHMVHGLLFLNSSKVFVFI